MTKRQHLNNLQKLGDMADSYLSLLEESYRLTYDPDSPYAEEPKNFREYFIDLKKDLERTYENLYDIFNESYKL